ncbi:MAG: efflux RND transporter permease subunit [Deltaproteobacteria bacterium]|nr:MAG: efflux RND transporter permease subunit [Deltaproteobacteria bacterium]
MSVITLTFDDNTPAKQARLSVSQRLSDVDLPESAKPDLSPDTTPVGEIYRYSLSGELPLDEQRLIQDWKLERTFKSIPGVADVVSFGGPRRTIEVELNLAQIKALGLSIDTVAQALGQNSANAGGGIVTHGEEAYLVRSLGLYEKPENLESAVVTTVNQIPIRVRDIGKVKIGNYLRLGQVGRNEKNDVVEGIILLRQGADTLGTCAEVRKTVARLNQSGLPAGVQIVPFYDRTNLIKKCSHTVFHNIFFGIFLVCLILVLGLGTQYWALILGVALIIPFALLISFVGVKSAGYIPNLISLGAVDFGIIVETAIFAAEAVIAMLITKKTKTIFTLSETLSEVLSPALLCAFLLLIAFVPILRLQRVEGRIFRPLGITLVSAVIGGQLGALIFIPTFSQLSPISEHPHKVFLDRFFDWVIQKCEKIVKSLSEVKHLLLYSGICFGIAVIVLMMSVGREFLPQLNEGALYIRATAPSTISRESASELAEKVRSRLKTIPEVKDVISQIGRPDDGTDVNGYNNVESFVVLDDPDHWKSAHDIDGFVKLGQKALSDLEGVQFNFSQPIKDNVDEAISGVKGELVVKIFGPNLEVLQKLADQIQTLVNKIPGAQDVAAEEVFGQPELPFKMNHDMLARYGLRVSDAEEVLESALRGKVATRMIDEQGRSIDVLVKPQIPDPPDRDTLAALPVITPDGAKIPLGDVSSPPISPVEGVSRVYREKGDRRIAVKSSVRGRPVVEFVNEANQKILNEVKLPPNYRLEWSGSFENAKRASQQLMILVPICLLVMIIILYSWFKNWKYVGYLLWEIPFSAIGGILGLKLTGLNLSISAAAGAVVLIGVSFLTGMMFLEDWILHHDVWQTLRDKSRSILISSLVAIVGLVPAAFSHGIGAETARPFAVMILSGLTTSLIFSLTLLPAFVARSHSNVAISLKNH